MGGDQCLHKNNRDNVTGAPEYSPSVVRKYMCCGRWFEYKNPPKVESLPTKSWRQKFKEWLLS